MTESTGAAYPVTGTLNSVLVIAIQVVVWGGLWLASGLSLPWQAGIGVVLSFLLLTNYALMHESAHGVLHRDPNVNRELGMLAGWMFPMSNTFLSVAHHVHHRGNRTDHEMFDYYYEDDNRLVKFGQWYGIMTGLYWPLVPLGSILMAAAPFVFRSSPFRRARSSTMLFSETEFTPAVLMRIRLEVVLGVAWWAALWNLLDIDWRAVAITYACFAFNWSTRQYVTHAFTPRDVIHGALNLKAGRVMALVLLNGHWDQAHHRFPHVPWFHLPSLATKTMTPVSYWKQYLRCWKGPRPNREPAPQPLGEQY